MFDLRLQILSRRLDAALIRKPEAVTREMGVAFRVIGSRFSRWFTRNRLSKSGDVLSKSSAPGVFRRTGSLARGYISKVEGQGDINRLKLTLGWIDPKSAQVATVQERGATITPKRAQYLTIPLRAALTPSGVPRRPSARSWTNTFFFKSKKGNLILAQKKGKGMTPLYVLKKQVKVPPRLEFEKSWNSQRFRRERIEILQEALRKGLRE